MQFEGLYRIDIENCIIVRMLYGESFIWEHRIAQLFWARGLGVMTSP